MRSFVPPRSWWLLVLGLGLFALAPGAWGKVIEVRNVKGPEHGPVVYATWSCTRLQGMGYLVIEGNKIRWVAGRGQGVTEPKGDVLLARKPRANESVVLETPEGQRAARVLEEPHRGNQFRTVIEIPTPTLSWDQGDHWDCDAAAGTSFEVRILLVPRSKWIERQLIPGERHEQQRKAFRYERFEDWGAALAEWRDIALQSKSPPVRRLAMDRYAQCHGRIEWVPTVADHAKADALRKESVRAHYGEEGELIAGRRVFLLWPKAYASHPSVPRFLAQLDLAYASLVELTGQDPFDVYGYRLCYFFMESGAAWFNHHIGMGSVEFQQYPPLNSVYLHEMGHDFFKYPTDLVAPESSWGEGMASFAQLRALEFVGMDPAGIRNLLRDGERQLERHLHDGGQRDALGAYLMGASLLAGCVPGHEAGLTESDWAGFQRVLARFKGATLAPRALPDRYRHWGALLEEEFGVAARARLERFGLPMDPPGASVAKLEREILLPGMAQAQAAFDEGQRAHAFQLWKRLAKREDHRLRGDVQYAIASAKLRDQDEKGAHAAAASLGFLRDWWIHRPLSSSRSSAFQEVFAPEVAHGGALLPVELWDRAGHVGERRLAPGEPRSTPLNRVNYVPHRESSVLGVVDVRALFRVDGQTEQATYALTRLIAKDACTVELRVGQDDDLAVFLNGEAVARSPLASTVHFDHRWFPLSLRAGDNLLMLKLVNRRGDWGFQARLTGPDGLAATDVTCAWPQAAAEPVASVPTTLWQIGTADGEFTDLPMAPREDPWVPHHPQGVRVQVTEGEQAAGWSHIHPGPRDSWAENRTHTFRIDFDCEEPDQSHQLVVWTVGQNGWTPPTLRISVGDQSTQFLLPGSPDSTLGDARQGTPCRLVVRVEPGLLRATGNTISLSIPKGSWILYDALEFQQLAGP